MKKGALDKKDKEDPTSSRRLSHSEVFLVASLLATAQSEIRLTPETSISGLVALIVLTADTAHDCFQETANRQNLALSRSTRNMRPNSLKFAMAS